VQSLEAFIQAFRRFRNRRAARVRHVCFEYGLILSLPTMNQTKEI